MPYPVVRTEVRRTCTVATNHPALEIRRGIQSTPPGSSSGEQPSDDWFGLSNCVTAVALAVNRRGEKGSSANDLLLALAHGASMLCFPSSSPGQYDPARRAAAQPNRARDLHPSGEEICGSAYLLAS